MSVHRPFGQKSRNNKNNFGNSPFKMLKDRITSCNKNNDNNTIITM